MKLVKTAAIAVTLAFAVVGAAAPADAFFLNKKGTKVAAERITSPIVSFFHALFGKK